MKYIFKCEEEIALTHTHLCSFTSVFILDISALHSVLFMFVNCMIEMYANSTSYMVIIFFLQVQLTLFFHAILRMKERTALFHSTLSVHYDLHSFNNSLPTHFILV